MSALTPALSASDRARLVRDARAIACGASTGTPTVEHLAALCATVDAVERERDAAVAVLAAAERHIDAMRGPLLHHFGTTDPALLAEVWEDQHAAREAMQLDAERWRILRDSSIGLRIVDGNATITDGDQLESLVDQRRAETAVNLAALRAARGEVG